jgi:N-acetylneuraminic acid mutarotase
MRLMCLAAMAVLLLAAAAPAGALPSYDVNVLGRLPAGNYRAASVEDGKAVYLFGGRDESNVTASVVRYDLRTGAASPAPFSLPQPRMSACAVLDGKSAYVFGGADGGLELDTILRLDLASGNVTTLEARLPSPRIGLAAAVFKGSAYIFGGHSNGTKITNITRFDLSTGKVSLMGASLPTGRAGMGIAATAKGIHLFGGKTDPGASDEVLFYDPARDNLAVLHGRLPYTVYHASAAASGGRVLLIGGSAQPAGQNVSRATDTIVEFDPATGASRILPERLPSPRERSSAARDGGRVLVLGGQEGVKALDEIVAISASGGASPEDAGMWPAAVAAAFLVPAAVALFVIGRRR